MGSFFKKQKIIVIILLISGLHFSNFFLNTYTILVLGYEERMERIYGSCDRESYGFIKNIGRAQHFDKNIIILNPNPNFAFNNSNWFIYKTNKDYYHNQLIIINEDGNLKRKDQDNYTLYYKKKIMGDYKIINKNKNCFYLKKNG